jgi:hypothetical protein
MAFWEIPIGFRYSSRRISPGVIGGFMGITYSVIGAVRKEEVRIKNYVPDGGVGQDIGNTWGKPLATAGVAP